MAEEAVTAVLGIIYDNKRENRVTMVEGLWAFPRIVKCAGRACSTCSCFSEWRVMNHNSCKG